MSTPPIGYSSPSISSYQFQQKHEEGMIEVPYEEEKEKIPMRKGVSDSSEGVSDSEEGMIEVPYKEEKEKIQMRKRVSDSSEGVSDNEEEMIPIPPEMKLPAVRVSPLARYRKERDGCDTKCILIITAIAITAFAGISVGIYYLVTSDIKFKITPQERKAIGLAFAAYFWMQHMNRINGRRHRGLFGC